MELSDAARKIYTERAYDFEGKRFIVPLKVALEVVAKIEAKKGRMQKAINRAIEVGHVEYLEGYLEQEATGGE